MVVGPALECKGVNFVNRDPKATSVSGGRGVASGDQRGGWAGEGEDTEGVGTLPRRVGVGILSGCRSAVTEMYLEQ